MAIERYRVQVDGLRQLKKLVKNGGDDLYGPPVTAALDRVGEVALASAKAAAAGFRRTGNTEEGLRYVVSKAHPIPLSVKIETTARALKATPGGKRRNRFSGWKLGRPWSRFPYPRALNYSKFDRYHHKFWLNNAVEAARPAIDGVLKVCAKLIEFDFMSKGKV